MKLKINIFLFVVAILWTFQINGQEKKYYSSQGLTEFVEKEKISVQNNSSKKMLSSINNKGYPSNIVQISQVGFNNYVDVYSRSDKSRISINQDGSNNSLEIFKKAKQINQSYVQSGNNNFISDFSLKHSRSAINMEMSQKGNNLKLYSTGSNSISKDLKINQFGNSGTIYIFNR
jgi:hypothetical protein